MKEFTIYNSAQETYDAMLQACRLAEKEIIFEQYIFEDFYPEGIAADFIKVFLEKAREGVNVILYLDAVGSFQVFMDNQLQEKLIEAGVEIRFYGSSPKWQWFNIPRAILRDHRKVLVIDRMQTWLGGVVVGDSYRDWDDLMVQIFHPKLAEQMAHHLISQFRHYQKSRIFKFKPIQIDDHTSIIGNSPGIKQRYISHLLYKKIKRAKNEITIITPYYSPTVIMEHELMKARKRGVQVNIVIPKNIADHKFINQIHQGFFDQFLRDGFNVYLYEKMHHAKAVIVDDWVTFGSTNFDYLSLVYNHELNLATDDSALVLGIKHFFSNMKDNAKILSKEDLPKTLSRKIGNELLKLARVVS